MTHFPEVTCRFLADLKDNNDRTWFEDNRDRYEAEWLAPAQSYLAAMSEAMANLSPPHKTAAKVNGSIRRIYRDTRFSKDKTPFDPKLHMVFWTGAHPNRSPAIHLVLHSDRAGCGAGQFAFSKDELNRYLQRVSDDPAWADALVTSVEAMREHGCILTEETLKRFPRGLSVLDRHETLVKRKGLVVRTGDAGLTTEFLCDRQQMPRFVTAAANLNAILCDAVLNDHKA